MFKKLCWLLFFLLIIQYSFAQSEWRMWDAVDAGLSVNKKTDVKFSHLRSYNITDSFTNNFNQASAQIDYDLNKHFTIRASGMYSSFPSGSASTIRGILRFSHKFSPIKKFTWTNGLQFEYHSNNETRFRERFIYITRLSLRKRIKFLRLSPSISYWLYYNIGGNTIKYYDPTGATYIRNTPNGIHRSRIILNLNSKINNNLSVSVYYLKQKEFNFLCPDDRKMNVSNPNNGKIYRPFDSYNVAGLSLQLDFKLKRKTSKK
jgi:hypothetical protein